MVRGPDREVTRTDVFEMFEPGYPETSSSIAENEEITVHQDTVYNRLRELYELDKIDTKKVGGRARVWWIPDPTRRVDPAVIEDENWQSGKDPDILRSLARATERNEPMTSGEIADEIGVTKNSCYNRLRALDTNYDVIESKKAGATSKVWWIEEEPNPKATA